MRTKQDARKPKIKAHQRAVTTEHEQRLKVKVAINEENLRSKIQPRILNQLLRGSGRGGPPSSTPWAASSLRRMNLLGVLLRHLLDVLFSLLLEVGGWHKVALEQFRKLGSALARHTGQGEDEKVGHLVKRVAILLQRGLSSMLLNRIPGHPPAVIDGQE